jgi:hypothetical protein
VTALGVLKSALLLIAAAVAGYVCQILAVPLPWMIGPMLLTAALGLSFGNPPVRWFYRPVGQVVVATSVGLYFTREALGELLLHGPHMVGAALLTIAAGYIAALVLLRLARTDGTTAFFSSMPGGPVEMAVLAERFGASGGPVALAQTMRIAGIVLIVAPALLWSQGALSSRPVAVTGPVDLKGLVLLYALAIAASLAMRSLKLSNAFFLGSVGTAAAITASGITLSAVPFPLLVAGQILLGVSLGSRFDREKLVGAGQFVVAGLVSTAVLLLLCFAIAVLMWKLGAGTLPSLTLATAPGSVTEMAIAAKAMNEAVAMVTAYHLVRIFIIIPLGTHLFRLFRKIAGRHVTFAQQPRDATD